jgi:hypothetical protein
VTSTWPPGGGDITKGAGSGDTTIFVILHETTCNVSSRGQTRTNRSLVRTSARIKKTNKRQWRHQGSNNTREQHRSRARPAVCSISLTQHHPHHRDFLDSNDDIQDTTHNSGQTFGWPTSVLRPNPERPSVIAAKRATAQGHKEDAGNRQTMGLQLPQHKQRRPKVANILSSLLKPNQSVEELWFRPGFPCCLLILTAALRCGRPFGMQ